MKIRDAFPDDAFAAGEVMRRSITELCTSDHGNDPIILRRWLSNKAPEIFRSWIRPGNSVLVAVDIETDNILASAALPMTERSHSIMSHLMRDSAA